MSTVPQPYERQASFTSFEANNPTSPKPGTSLDAELNAIRSTLNATLSRLNEIQRDDGRIRNASVHPDAFTSDALILIGSDITPRGVWAAAVAYNARDLVQQAGSTYIALVAHLSNNFTTDLALGRWQALTATSAASDTPFSPAGGLSSTNVQAAIVEVQSNVGGRQPTAAYLTQLSGLPLTANTLAYCSAAGVLNVMSSTPIGRIIMGAATAAIVRETIDLIPGTDPLNIVRLDGSSRLPAVDASQVTNVNIPLGYVSAAQLADTLDLSSKTLTLPPGTTPAISKSFQSTQQTITAGGVLSLAHGLSEVPKIVMATLVCTTAEHGYAVNDEVIIGYGPQNTVDNGIAITISSSSIGVKFGAAASSLRVLNESTGSNAGITNASWRLVIRAYA
jgi:hypothetical protein